MAIGQPEVSLDVLEPLLTVLLEHAAVAPLPLRPTATIQTKAGAAGTNARSAAGAPPSTSRLSLHPRPGSAIRATSTQVFPSLSKGFQPMSRSVFSMMNSSLRTFASPFLPKAGAQNCKQMSALRTESNAPIAVSASPATIPSTPPLFARLAQSASDGVPPLALAARAALATATSAKSATGLDGGRNRAVQLYALVPALLAAGKTAGEGVDPSPCDALGNTIQGEVTKGAVMATVALAWSERTLAAAAWVLDKEISAICGIINSSDGSSRVYKEGKLGRSSNNSASNGSGKSHFKLEDLHLASLVPSLAAALLKPNEPIPPGTPDASTHDTTSRCFTQPDLQISVLVGSSEHGNILSQALAATQQACATGCCSAIFWLFAGDTFKFPGSNCNSKPGNFSGNSSGKDSMAHGFAEKYASYRSALLAACQQTSHSESSWANDATAALIQASETGFNLAPGNENFFGYLPQLWPEDKAAATAAVLVPAKSACPVVDTMLPLTKNSCEDIALKGSSRHQELNEPKGTLNKCKHIPKNVKIFGVKESRPIAPSTPPPAPPTDSPTSVVSQVLGSSTPKKSVVVRPTGSKSNPRCRSKLSSAQKQQLVRTEINNQDPKRRQTMFVSREVLVASFEEDIASATSNSKKSSVAFNAPVDPPIDSSDEAQQRKHLVAGSSPSHQIGLPMTTMAYPDRKDATESLSCAPCHRPLMLYIQRKYFK